ncbi:MAG: CO dehydrogenase/acetyl-CoA synthase subunit delta [Candidatus Altiarchaeota archaeon]|nr:CO dehydrogenase/acetyl-CoA synthase subunit delta [Candidatus Altiarchaeota archaeon]
MASPRFKLPKEGYKQRISVVSIGATRRDGGTRDKSYRIGGENTPAFHYFDGFKACHPVISEDVFDIPIHLPGNVRHCFGDAMEDPRDWARLRVKKYAAKMITLHLVSTDPKVGNTSIAEACKTIEDVLQAVKVPLIIGGSGNPDKDPELLSKAAEVCSGESVVLSSVGPDMNYRQVAEAAVKHDQSLVSLISMNPDEMRRFNRNLMKLGVKPSNIIMDLFTGGIGYGVEYSISAMERCRLLGLQGDPFLSLPIASATSNAWSAREAWMHNEEWGPRELRGPLWESSTASMALLSGADLFMMLHPFAVDCLESLFDALFKPGDLYSTHSPYSMWVEG